jgi:peptide/nickel transport system permease protein
MADRVPGADAVTSNVPSESEERRARHRRVLSAVLPGVPQIAAGRVATGSAALLTWLAMVVICMLHGDRVLAAAGGAWDERLSLLTLVACLAGSWWWSWRNLASLQAPRDAALSQWDLAIRSFAKNRTAVAGLITIAGLYLMALLTPLITPYDPILQGDLYSERLVPASAAHWLGTDQFARDLLSRLMYGARISLSVGFVAVAISVTIGTLVGAVAGYVGGKVDAALMRLVDVIIAFPRLILLIAVIAAFDGTIVVITLVLGLTLWPGTARIVRAEVLSLREREFIQAAEALGFARRRIVLRHLVPNVMAPVIVAATLGIGNTIVLEAGLSFLGFGVQPPTPSWGSMVASGRPFMMDAWWLTTFPGLAIVFTVLSFNLVGDGLRDALDPRIRR